MSTWMHPGEELEVDVQVVLVHADGACERGDWYYLIAFVFTDGPMTGELRTWTEDSIEKVEVHALQMCELLGLPSGVADAIRAAVEQWRRVGPVPIEPEPEEEMPDA